MNWEREGEVLAASDQIGTLAPHRTGAGWASFLPAMREFGAFFWKHVQCSVFVLYLFACMGLTRVTTFGLPRYDVLFVLSLFGQIWMVRKGLETLDELRVICVFHVIGLALELYKVSHGSWTYPE